jgi:hypothetical protein
LTKQPDEPGRTDGSFRREPARAMPAPSVHMDPEDAVIIDALADHMERILTGLHAFGGPDSGWAVAGDSPVVDEQELLVRQYGPKGAWSADAATYVGDAALLFLTAQADHFRVLHLIYAQHSGLMFGLAPPARSLLEINGYVFWLLHPEINSIRTRASRALLSQLNDVRRQRSAAKALDAPAAWLTRLGEEVNNLKARVDAEFYPSEIARTDSGLPVLRDETNPGPGEALRHLSLSGTDDWNSRGVYSYLSNKAHPTVHVISDTIQPAAEDRPSRFGYPDTQYHYRLARIAMIALLSTWQLTAAYRGLDQEPATVLLRQIDALPTP